MNEYFDFMTTQMRESLPMIDIMIKNEKDSQHKRKMETAKKHLQELIKKKENLKRECVEHSLSEKQCCEKAEVMRTELHKVLTEELN